MELAEEDRPAADPESVPPEFIEQKSNAIFLGGVGLGKTHRCIALGHAACVRCYTVLFTTAIDIIHTLSAAAAVPALEMRLPPARPSRRGIPPTER